MESTGSAGGALLPGGVGTFRDISFTVAGEQSAWLLCLTDWEHGGYRIASSLQIGEGTYLICPDGWAYPVVRTSRGTWSLGVYPEDWGGGRWG